MRRSIFTFQDAGITTCKVIIKQWLQPAMITICFGIFIAIQVFAIPSSAGKKIKKLKMSGYKSLGQNFMPSSSLIHS